MFLTRLEQGIHVMESGVTLLVDDTSGDYRASVVYLDTHVRQTAPTEHSIHSASQADMGLLLCPVMRQCEADTWHDQSCDLAAAIRYTIDALGRSERDIALGWEDVRDPGAGEPALDHHWVRGGVLQAQARGSLSPRVHTSCLEWAADSMHQYPQCVGMQRPSCAFRCHPANQFVFNRWMCL